MTTIFATEKELKYLVTDSSGASGLMVFAYWVDEIVAAKRKLAKAGRGLVSIQLIK